MLKIEFSEEYNKSLVNEIVSQLVPVLIQELKQNELPHLMTRLEFMEMAGISAGKCNELFNRQGFPVNRELGNPRVPTKDFFEWINKTNQNSEGLNIKYPYGVG